MTAEPCTAVEPLQSAWLDDRLDGSERDRVARHLQSCARCRAAVDGLDRTRTLLRGAPVRAMPASLLASITVAARQPQPDGSAEVAPPSPAYGDACGVLDRRLLQAASSTSRAAGRVATFAFAVVGLLGAAAFALGGEPPAADRRVEVPVDLFVADHMVRTVSGPVSTPVLVER